MPHRSSEENELRSVALQNATSILQARHRAEQELVDAKNALEEKTDELAQSLAMVQATLESSSDGILVTNANRKVTGSNRKYAEMWGISPEVMEVKDHEKILKVISKHFHDPFAFLAKVEEIYKTAPPQSFDLLKLLDGRMIERVSNIQFVGNRNAGRVWNFRDISERTKIEKEVRDQRERFLVTLRSIGDSVITTDIQGRITFLNPVAEAMTGWSSNEVTGQPLETVFNIVDESTRVPLPNPVGKVLREGVTSDPGNHTALIARDGTEKSIEDKATPIYDAQGTITGAVMVFHDVTERRLAQRALQESEAKVRATFAQAAVGFAVTDLKGNIEEVNQRYVDILGYPMDEAKKLTFKDVTHPDDIALTEREMRRLTAGEIPHYSIEKRYLRKDHSIVWSLTTVTLLRDAAGMPQHFLGVIEDISLRKEAEESLRDETRILELLKRTGTAIASKLDLQDLVQTVTDAGRELSGAAFGAFFYNVIDENGEALLLYTLSGAPREAFKNFGLPRHTPVFTPTFQGTSVVRSSDITQDPRYGTMDPHHGMPHGHLPVRSYLAVPVISRSGEVIGGLLFGHPEPDVFTERSERLITGVASQAAIAIDNARLFESAQKEIEDRKKIEEALLSAQDKLSLHAGKLEADVVQRTAHLNESIRSLESVCYTIAHDLRAPLRTVQGFTTAILEDYGPAFDENGRVLAQRIVAAATRMDALIRDLLEYAKLSHQELPSQNVDLNLSLQKVIDTFRDEIETKKGRIQIEKLPVIWGNPTLVEQIFTNLIGNALKFTSMERAPEIRIGTDSRPYSERIFVQDNGIGIAKEHHERVFEIFQRLHPNEKSYEGTGVGLAIVKKGIERIHGAIGIDSTTGHGTCFLLDFQPGRKS